MALSAEMPAPVNSNNRPCRKPGKVVLNRAASSVASVLTQADYEADS
jgi:hypothetical protein